jgi:hypothetical protein
VTSFAVMRKLPGIVMVKLLTSERQEASSPAKRRHRETRH